MDCRCPLAGLANELCTTRGALGVVEIWLVCRSNKPRLPPISKHGEHFWHRPSSSTNSCTVHLNLNADRKIFSLIKVTKENSSFAVDWADGFLAISRVPCRGRAERRPLIPPNDMKLRLISTQTTLLMTTSAPSPPHAGLALRLNQGNQAQLSGSLLESLRNHSGASFDGGPRRDLPSLGLRMKRALGAHSHGLFHSAQFRPMSWWCDRRHYTPWRSFTVFVRDLLGPLVLTSDEKCPWGATVCGMIRIGQDVTNPWGVRCRRPWGWPFSSLAEHVLLVPGGQQPGKERFSNIFVMGIWPVPLPQSIKGRNPGKSCLVRPLYWSVDHLPRRDLATQGTISGSYRVIWHQTFREGRGEAAWGVPSSIWVACNIEQHPVSWNEEKPHHLISRFPHSVRILRLQASTALASPHPPVR